MSDEQVAAAAATNEQTQQGAAAVEQATPKEGIRDVDAPLENAETPAADQAKPGTEEGTEETEQKRLSRSQRYQRKISALSGVIERSETEKQDLRQQLETLQKAKAPDTTPNPADFPNGEWDTGYIAKLAAHEALKAVKGTLDERTQKDEQERQSSADKTAAQNRAESAAKVRERIADFDDTLKTFIEDGGDFAPHVKAAINATGDKAPLIAYNLAKDPDLADRLNGMSREEVLLEIGELRAKATLPERKTITKALAPLTAVKGGAAPTADIHALAKSDSADDYVAARRAQRKARA